MYAIGAPRKVRVPLILAWMKELNFLAGLRIDSMRFRPFVAVAPGTREAKVILRRSSAPRQRDDVLNMHLSTTNDLCSLAVFTAMVRGSKYTCADVRRNIVHSVTELEVCQQWFSGAQAEQGISSCFAQGDASILAS